MFYKLSGYPEVDEIVLCKVTKIYPNSVFVDLLEYENKSGIVHISEVSPGRIRNLRDFVSIDRQIVCKVLKVDKERGHIDLSLRRVNSNQRREKLDEIKGELKAESLVKNLSKKLQVSPNTFYRQITDKVFKEYSHLYLCFRDVAEGELELKKLGFDAQLATELHNAILEKFKPKKITVKGELRLHTYSPEGVEKIKETLQEIENVSETITLFYLGAGRYKLIIEDFEYKSAEKNLQKIESVLQGFNDKQSQAAFEREKNE